MCACKEALCFQLCLKESGCAHHAHKLALVVVMAISFGTSTTTRLSYWQVWRFSVFTVMHFTTRQFWCVYVYCVFLFMNNEIQQQWWQQTKCVCVCIFLCIFVSTFFFDLSLWFIFHKRSATHKSSCRILQLQCPSFFGTTFRFSPHLLVT